MNTKLKNVLTSDEAVEYLGIKKSYLYKLTMQGKIPYYKPLGKKNYYKREELEAWLTKGRNIGSTVNSNDIISDQLDSLLTILDSIDSSLNDLVMYISNNIHKK